MATIKFTNGVLLDESSIDGLKGIDFNNVIATTSSASYTAIQDCFAVQSDIGNAINMGINGHSMLQYSKSNASDKGSAWVLVKKGQIVSTASRSTTIYGIK